MEICVARFHILHTLAMDTTLLGNSRQFLDSEYRTLKAYELLKRGYTKNEVREIFRRAMIYLEERIEPSPGTGKIEPLRREFSAAIAEVLADSPDIAVGRFA
jgi:hypothetical protein